jgi:hypothetical protein
MSSTNINKIKPAFRTTGRVSGNFGRSKVKSGSTLKDIGVTKAKVLNLTTQDEYLQRMITAYHSTTDINLKKFIYDEIRKIEIQRGIWKGQ